MPSRNYSDFDGSFRVCCCPISAVDLLDLFSARAIASYLNPCLTSVSMESNDCCPFAATLEELVLALGLALLALVEAGVESAD